MVSWTDAPTPLTNVTGLGTGVPAALALNTGTAGGFATGTQIGGGTLAGSFTTLAASGAFTASAGATITLSSITDVATFRNTLAAGYSGIGFQDNTSVQRVSVGYPNASAGGLVAGKGYINSVSKDIVVTTNNGSSAGMTILAANAGLTVAIPITSSSSLTFAPPASITPANNGDLTAERTSNTSLTIKLKGTDGTVRSVVLTLAP